MSSWSSCIPSRLALVREVRDHGDLLVFLHSACFALALPALLRLSLPRLQALLGPPAARQRARPGDADRIVTSVLAMLRVGRPLIRRGCLTRGLTLYYFLSRAGVDVTLCFGIGKVGEHGDGFDGHCWLVKDGEPYLEPRDPRPLYTEMYTFGGTRHSQTSVGPTTLWQSTR